MKNITAAGNHELYRVPEYSAGVIRALSYEPRLSPEKIPTFFNGSGVSPDEAPSAFVDHKDNIWRPEWNDAGVGVTFRYDRDGTLALPLYKTYGSDGKVRVHFRGESPDGSSMTAPAENPGKVTAPSSKNGGGILDSLKKNSGECHTCSSRQYKDASNDMGVSFKMPGHISPEASVSKVMSHESEHEGRADREGGRVYTQKRIHMAQCPECSKMYAAGGETQVIKLGDDNEKSAIDAFV